jgi:S-DNA-T family DNA segregation ATPase FtsK/SpoIIIE
VTTATKRPAGRSGAPRSKNRPAASSRSRSKPSASARGNARTRRKGNGKGSRALQREGFGASLWTVVAAHASDVWGVVLVTVGILAALAFYADSLNPAGHGARLGVGDLLGWGRFLVPPVAVAVGILLLVRRGDDADGRTEREPARAVIGATLTLVSVAGLAALAGGSPSIRASTAQLSSAGGWVGALIANPLRAALGGFGAATILVAVLVVAMVLFTGVSIQQAARSIVRAVAWTVAATRGAETEDADGELDDDHPTDPFGRTVRATESGVVADAPVTIPVEPPEPPELFDEAPGDEPEPELVPAPAEAPKAVHGSQLEMKLGPSVGDWRLPPSTLLKRAKPHTVDEREVDAGGAALVAALAAHGVDTRLVGRTVGPTVTRYELELGPGVKVARVTSLSKDIAYAMASPDVRILAPIPGKSAIGVEVPNRRRELVALGDILASPEAASAHHPLEVALGRDIAGRAVMVNLAEMPHVLVSGATGSGKSSCINSVLTSILTRATPDQVRLILVDPKRVELGQYNDLPHLLTQVVVDPKKAANALAWAVTEMERRYDLLAEVGMRDITGYNTGFDQGDLADFEEAYQLRMRGTGADAGDDVEGQEVEPHYNRLPFILIVVDELNDLMMVAARDVEESVCRIAQMARAVGIHLVLATQRPSVDVITGVIKANIPSRMAFSVSTQADSRVILDQGGAERLIGKGDMLLLSASSSNPQRLQGPWVSEEEVRAVAAHWKRQRPMEVLSDIEEVVGTESRVSDGDDGDDDALLEQAMELVVRSQLGSTSMLQRKLRVGFARAGRLMDLMERRGVVGPSEGSKARAVLMTPEELDAR